MAREHNKKGWPLLWGYHLEFQIYTQRCALFVLVSNMCYITIYTTHRKFHNLIYYIQLLQFSILETFGFRLCIYIKNSRFRDENACPKKLKLYM